MPHGAVSPDSFRIRFMPLYLIAIYRPDGYDPAQEDAVMAQEIDSLNDAMVAAGVRRFVGGLQSPDLTVFHHRRDDGSVETLHGVSCLSGGHIGGLWVLEVASQEEASEWGAKAAQACRASVEVRPFH